MNFIDWLLIAAILLVAAALIVPAVRGHFKARAKVEQTLDPEAAARRKLFGQKVGLTFAALLLAEKIDQMRLQAQALTLPDADNPHSASAREKSIILEQIRIADSHQKEIAKAMADFTPATFEAVRWPFTAAKLQLSFAQKRLDIWPAITPIK